ncbi:phospholipase A(1) DAD1, chloroplastic-like [Arachis hypogaea]|uniref:phospholipase A(1) DAD1, chloroplastic-like n=1 Tax=Arachis hypogaea TaxID=3818 RepID=UPI000DEC5DBD|nr:phospholipase A(1) DAD1, chloroplastic-like [Arachis hypogaea]
MSLRNIIPTPSPTTLPSSYTLKPRCVNYITTHNNPSSSTKPTTYNNLSLSNENTHQQATLHLEKMINLEDHNSLSSSSFESTPSTSSFGIGTYQNKLGKRWKEYQGMTNWEGLLDPLDDNLRAEILRYGHFVEAAYKSFEFDPSSPNYANCRFPKTTLFERCGLPNTGYKVTKYLRATSGIQLPNWVDKAPSWVATQSSYVGYVAVCDNKEEIKRLGRRDVVIAFRGTTTCLEWLENLRATLTNLPCNPMDGETMGCHGSGAMVESGFLSLYSSSIPDNPSALSLQQMVKQEIVRILQAYAGEPLSLTITGHSLGAALATLAAYDINTSFPKLPVVTVISFGGPRVGDRRFRRQLEKQGTKVLRIVNSKDVITKVPGFVFDDDMAKEGGIHVAGLPSWIQKRVEKAQWVYAEVGKELRLCSRDSPYLGSTNVATCHELNTYLHLVDGFVSSTCPFRATAKRFLQR